MHRRFVQFGLPLVVAGVMGATVAALPATAADPSLGAQLVALTNADRAAHGLPPLVVSAGLTRAAQTWSDFELSIGTLEHVGFPAVFLAPTWQAWGENVGMGGNPGQINAAFMASPSHEANILGNYNRIGVGVSVRGDGREFVDVEFERVP
ncbi:MAG TPA: CAP domain-containing protein [Acidimicrobiales bacterium]|jgi:uncharacterized protein YkwD